jgi:predicted metal-dependent phosphoesterase TrpH
MQILNKNKRLMKVNDINLIYTKMEKRKIIETVRTIETIDLHIHTKSSDGAFTPIQIVRKAKEKGLSAIAITDHDCICVSEVKKAIEEGKRLNIKVIPGVEISTKFAIPKSKDRPTDVHLLGLFVDFNNDDFNNDDFRILVNTLEKHSEAIKNKKRIKILQGLVGKEKISYKKVKEYQQTESFGNYHIRQYLVSERIRNDGEARKLFIEGGKAYIESNKHPTFEEFIKLIQDAGGLAVLAHPIFAFISFMNLEIMIESMKNFGLDGIETYHSDNTDYTSECMVALADEYGLCKSGGSDFHGTDKYKQELGTGIEGNLCVPYSILDDLRKYKSKK